MTRAAVDCVFESITKALKKKDTVTLVGFGTFKLSKRKVRKGRNSQTGEEIKIKARGSPCTGKNSEGCCVKISKKAICIKPSLGVYIVRVRAFLWPFSKGFKHGNGYAC